MILPFPFRPRPWLHSPDIVEMRRALEAEETPPDPDPGPPDPPPEPPRAA